MGRCSVCGAVLTPLFITLVCPNQCDKVLSCSTREPIDPRVIAELFAELENHDISQARCFLVEAIEVVT